MPVILQVLVLVTCCCRTTNHPHTQTALQQQLLSPTLRGSGVLVWFDGVLSFTISGKAAVKVLPRAAVSSRLLGENLLSLAWFGQDSAPRGPLHWGPGSSRGVGWRCASGPWHVSTAQAGRQESTRQGGSHGLAPRHQSDILTSAIVY